MSATVSGTRANPHGDGHLDLHNGVAYGTIVPLLKSDLRLADGELQFNNIDASALRCSTCRERRRQYLDFRGVE